MSEDTSGIRILFVTQHYPPEAAATGQLLAELAEDLVSDGFQATVLAGRPHYGVAGADDPVPLHEWRNGVEIIRTYCTRFPRTSLPGRAVNWFSYTASSLLRGAVGVPRPDIVVAYTTPPTVPPVGLLLARRWRARFVVYFQDLYPAIAVAVGAMRSGLLARAWRFLNRFVYRRAEGALALGDHMAECLGREGVSPDRISVVHNWADGERLYPLPTRDNPMRKASGLEGRFVILYSGNLGMAHDFEPVCEAMGRLRPYGDRLTFVFVGDGVRRQEVESYVRKNDLAVLAQFRDYVPKDQLLMNLSQGDAGLLTALEGTEGLVVPSKFYAYLAVGRPVLAVCHRPNEISDIVKEAGCGFVTTTGEELAEAVVALMKDPELRLEMGRRARAVFEERFDRRKATSLIGRILGEVAAEAL